MPLEVNFPKALLEGTKQSLSRIRHAAWAVFLLTLGLGLILSGVLVDATQFARAGSIGVVIGIVFARWRFLILKAAEKKLEDALRNPQEWLEKGIRRQFPGLDVTHSGGYKVFSQDDVSGAVGVIVGELDSLVFRDEAAIIITSTLIWGYGDLFLPCIYVAMAC